MVLPKEENKISYLSPRKPYLLINLRTWREKLINKYPHFEFLTDSAMKLKITQEFIDQYLIEIAYDIVKQPQITNKMLIQTLISKTTSKPLKKDDVLRVIGSNYNWRSLKKLQKANANIYKSDKSLMKAYYKAYRKIDLIKE